MTYQFTSILPLSVSTPPVLISGEDSLKFESVAYLLVEDDETVISYEIRYQYHCSPFKQAIVAAGIVAVGFEGHFYLFDRNSNRNLLTLEVDLYFGHLYLHKGLFYVAGACGVYCVNESGYVLWYNQALAVDGVIIDRFEEGRIYGRGEQDPPGGWRDFVLDLHTGESILKIDQK